MTWTTTPPTVPGWYWADDGEVDSAFHVAVQVVHVVARDQILLSADLPDRLYVHRIAEIAPLDRFVRWAGPLEAPE